MENKEYIVSIDIGSYGVVMSVGEKNENGPLHIRGVEFVEIEDCVKDGDICNYQTLGDAIIKAKRALENELNLELKSAYVGISGRSVYCVRYEDYIDVKSRDMSISAEDVRELNNRIEEVSAGGGDVIVQRLPLRYRVDERQEVKNPIGSFGRRLSATYLFVISSKQQVDRVNLAMFKAEMEVAGLCINPVVMADAILSKDEREAGVAIVDIGGDVTDISIIREGKLWYFASLPIGGSAINNDLHEFLKIPKADIEQKKRKYGASIAESIPLDALVPINMPGRAKKHILKRNIAEITEARLKDIASLVLRELQSTKMQRKLNGGVILTGGSAYLSDIDQLFAQELNMDVRVCDTIYGVDEESAARLSCCNETAVIATMLYGAKHLACITNDKEPITKDTPKENPPLGNPPLGDEPIPTPPVNPDTENDGEKREEKDNKGDNSNETESNESNKSNEEEGKDKKISRSLFEPLVRAWKKVDKYLNDEDTYL